MKTLRFGIEIETVGLSRTKLAEAIHSVVGGTISNDYRDVRITTASGRTWKVVPDGSLSGGENSGEIVSPVLGYDDIEELQNIIRAVRTAGARTDHSTGIHIHVGAESFDAVVCGQDAKHKKPDPEIFLLAASRLGVTPDESLVVEDAVNGVSAAKAGGFRCLGLTTSFSARELSEADWTAPDLAHVPAEALGW